MKDNRLQVRITAGGDLEKWLVGRTIRMHSGSPSVQARTELALCRDLLAAELQGHRMPLAWINCIADVLDSPLGDTVATVGDTVGVPIGIAYLEATEAFASAKKLLPYATKFYVDEDDVRDWLVGLGPAADYALRDAVAHWWMSDLPPTDEGWAAVGVTTIPVRHLRAFEVDDDGPLRRAYELAIAAAGRGGPNADE